MSKILAKPFDAAQKILRAIFRGSPNLFTTSDLNRQIEAFDTRIRGIENRMYSGVVSDVTLVIEGDTCTISLTHLELWGMVLHSGSTRTQTFPYTAVSASGKIYLWFTTKTVTYADDATHTISGAKFEDGTSKAAADHLVIDTWGLSYNIPDNAESVVMFSDVTSRVRQTRCFAPPTFNAFKEMQQGFKDASQEVSDLSTEVTALKDSIKVTRVDIMNVQDKGVVNISNVLTDFYGSAHISMNDFWMTINVNVTTTFEGSTRPNRLLLIPLYEYFTEEELSWIADRHIGLRTCVLSSNTFRVHLYLYEKGTGGSVDGVSAGLYAALSIDALSSDVQCTAQGVLCIPKD